MNIRDLINELEDIASEYSDDIEVRIAEQPSWPFENEIAQVVAVDLLKEDCEVCRGSCMEDTDDGEQTCTACNGSGVKKAKEDEGIESIVVYLGEGNQIGYLPGAARQALEWSN
jgi:hypothetical protein